VPPALGGLGRSHLKLRDIEGQTDEPTVTEASERAREDILAFLELPDGWGMKQYGRAENRG